jgi:hypothetical protein
MYTATPDLLAYVLFARVNPILPPRRKAATAWRWVTAWFACGRDFCRPEMREWAVEFLLDHGRHDMPPGWGQNIQGGYPYRVGGVEDEVCFRLAGMLTRIVRVEDIYRYTFRIAAPDMVRLWLTRFREFNPLLDLILRPEGPYPRDEVLGLVDKCIAAHFELLPDHRHCSGYRAVVQEWSQLPPNLGVAMPLPRWPEPGEDIVVTVPVGTYTLRNNPYPCEGPYELTFRFSGSPGPIGDADWPNIPTESISWL